MGGRLLEGCHAGCCHGCVLLFFVGEVHLGVTPGYEFEWFCGSQYLIIVALLLLLRAEVEYGWFKNGASGRCQFDVLNASVEGIIHSLKTGGEGA